MDPDPGWVPAACTLPTVEQPLRLAEFDRVFADWLHAVDALAARAMELSGAVDPPSGHPMPWLARRPA